jgi:hypothetical protein
MLFAGALPGVELHPAMPVSMNITTVIIATRFMIFFLPSVFISIKQIKQYYQYILAMLRA